MKQQKFASLILAALTLFSWTICEQVFSQSEPQWHMVYEPSHRATFEQEWKYSFSSHQSKHWFIALRFPPELPWSSDVEATAELLTSDGWIPFSEVSEGSSEKRRMLVIDHQHRDRELRRGFTIRTRITATISHQTLKRGAPQSEIPLLNDEERKIMTSPTETFDFESPIVERWMDRYKLWKEENETDFEFVHRVYKTLRNKLPYNTKDGGRWICSQILKVGFGECARHAIVGTSILRANKIPARAICALWAADENSTGAHCWGEFYLEGTGWVPFDTSFNQSNRDTDDHFGFVKGDLIAGMINFDWGIDAGPFGEHTVFAVDAWPAYWSAGSGRLGNPKVDTTTKVHILERF